MRGRQRRCFRPDRSGAKARPAPRATSRRRARARSRPSVAASAPPNVTSSMRPEWLISMTASGRASAGHTWQRLATCWATNDVIEMPASATLPSNAPRHHCDQQRRFRSLGRQSGRSSSSAPRRRTARRHSVPASPAGRDRARWAPSTRQPSAASRAAGSRATVRSSNSRQRPLPKISVACARHRPARRREHRGFRCPAAHAAAPQGVGALSQYSRIPFLHDRRRHADRARIERHVVEPVGPRDGRSQDRAALDPAGRSASAPAADGRGNSSG